jgi:hypothetical protein
MIGDHHGQSAGQATLLVRAVDAILGTHSWYVPQRRSVCSLVMHLPDPGGEDLLASGDHLGKPGFLDTQRAPYRRPAAAPQPAPSRATHHAPAVGGDQCP